MQNHFYLPLPHPQQPPSSRGLLSLKFPASRGVNLRADFSPFCLAASRSSQASSTYPSFPLRGLTSASTSLYFPPRPLEGVDPSLPLQGLCADLLTWEPREQSCSVEKPRKKKIPGVGYPL